MSVLKPLKAWKHLARKPHTIRYPAQEHLDMEGTRLPTDRLRGFHSNDLELMVEVGKVYIKLDSLDRADRIFNEVTWIDSSYAEAEYYLGLTAALRNDLYDAQVHWKHAASTMEPYFQTVRRLANIRLGALYDRYFNNLNEAIRYYENALNDQNSPVDSVEIKRVLLPLSKLYIRANQPIKASDLLAQIIYFDSSNLEARYFYALALWRSGQKDQAISELQIITQTAPQGKIYENAQKMLKDIRGY